MAEAMSNLTAKRQAEETIDSCLAALTTDAERKAFLRVIGTYSFIKLASLEGTERAAMAAYCLGDHLVDPKMEIRG